MEAVILIGIQGAGKSTFSRERLWDSHVRLNLDMLRTRQREELLRTACLTGKQAFVSDNTNLSVAERRRTLRPAREHEFRVVGYYFQSVVADCLARNRLRHPDRQVPDLAIRGAIGRLEHPSPEEGFDALHYVRISESGFLVEQWQV